MYPLFLRVFDEVLETLPTMSHQKLPPPVSRSGNSGVWGGEVMILMPLIGVVCGPYALTGGGGGAKACL